MDELIGLLPAAGRGSRLGAIPCSKEIMPLGFGLQTLADTPQWRPVTALEMHLQALRQAGVRRSVVVISESKPDIVRYIGDGTRYGLSVGYLYQQQLSGMPFALNLAAPWIGSATTVFAMPDTLVTPVDTTARLVQQHQQQPADLTLGLFHTSTPHKFGMVELGRRDDVLGFIDKPAQSTLDQMWGLAVWSARFTDFMAKFLAGLDTGRPEAVLSDVFQAALHGGLRVRAYRLEHAQYHDIGTPEDFQAVVYTLAQQQAMLLK